MKKIFVLICIALITFHIKVSQAASCSSEYGVVVTGINGKNYCLSKRGINWWSTFAWCNKAEGFSEPVSVEDCECTGYEGCDETVACPNLKIGYNAIVWTATNLDSMTSVAVNLSTGNFETTFHYHADSVYRSLCKQNGI